LVIFKIENQNKMFFKKLEAKKEEKKKKEPFEKILLRDKTSSGFYFFWDSFQPPSAFFLWLEIKNQFYSNTLSHDAGNLNFRCNSNVFFLGGKRREFQTWKRRNSAGRRKSLCVRDFLLTPTGAAAVFWDGGCCCWTPAAKSASVSHTR
jgi:hypothetical protein